MLIDVWVRWPVVGGRGPAGPGTSETAASSPYQAINLAKVARSTTDSSSFQLVRLGKAIYSEPPIWASFARIGMAYTLAQLSALRLLKLPHISST